MNTMDDRATAYVLGMLSEDEAVALEHELVDNPGLRNDVSSAQMLFDDLAKCEELMEVQPSVRERLLESVVAGAPRLGMLRRLRELFDLGAVQAQRWLDVAGQLTDKHWQETGIAGAKLVHLDGGPSVVAADCGLIQLAPGTTFPYHEHIGDEWALVLQGCIAEQGGRSFDVGDVAFSAAGSGHALNVVGSQPVILATVNFVGIRVTAPAKPSGST